MKKRVANSEQQKAHCLIQEHVFSLNDSLVAAAAAAADATFSRVYLISLADAYMAHALSAHTLRVQHGVHSGSACWHSELG